MPTILKVTERKVMQWIERGMLLEWDTVESYAMALKDQPN